MATMPPQPFRFLDLYPELRNHVYEMALTMAPKRHSFHDRPAVILTPPRRATDDSNQTSSQKREAWPKLARNFLGLTQTSKQLRQEFLGLFYERVETGISLVDLQSWLTHVIIPARSAFVPFDRETHVVASWPLEIDITNLVTLVRTSKPSFRLTFNEHLCALNNLFCASITQPSWRPFLDNFVTRIDLRLESGERTFTPPPPPEPNTMVAGARFHVKKGWEDTFGVSNRKRLFEYNLGVDELMRYFLAPAGRYHTISASDEEVYLTGRFRKNWDVDKSAPAFT